MKKQSGPLGGKTQKVRQGRSAARWKAAQPTELVTPLSQAGRHLPPSYSVNIKSTVLTCFYMGSLRETRVSFQQKPFWNTGDQKLPI